MTHIASIITTDCDFCYKISIQ